MIHFLKFTWNSFFISASATLAMLVVTSMAAYAFARINFAFKKIAFPILLSGMMIPVSSTLVPLFFTIRDLNLMDTQAAVILLGIYYPIGLLLLRQFMMTIPKSYDEAAYIDGASRLRIFWSIILPMSRSTMIVAAVLCFVVNWNNYLVPLVFLNSEGNYPLTLGMQFLKDSWTIDQTVMLAAVVLSVSSGDCLHHLSEISAAGRHHLGSEILIKRTFASAAGHRPKAIIIMEITKGVC